MTDVGDGTTAVRRFRFERDGGERHTARFRVTNRFGESACTCQAAPTLSSRNAQRTQGSARIVSRTCFAGLLIEFDHHECIAAALFPRQAQRRDVEFRVGQQRRDARHAALHVFGHQDDRVQVAGDFHRIAIDLVTSTRPAPSDDPCITARAVVARDGDAHGVRMHLVVFAERRLLEGVVQSFALHDVERGAEAFVVGPEAHQPADDRLVGAVPFAGAREGAVEFDAGRLRRAAHQAAGEEPQSAGARRVGGRGPDHDRADDVEEGDHGDKGIARAGARIRSRGAVTRLGAPPGMTLP